MKGRKIKTKRKTWYKKKRDKKMAGVVTSVIVYLVYQVALLFEE
jgi:hypothetical protein